MSINIKIKSLNDLEKANLKFNTQIISFVFKKYIKPKCKEYLKKQNNSDKDSWYLTNREFDEQSLKSFFEFIENDINNKLK